MVGEIKLLQYVRRFYHDMGIYPPQPNSNRLFNVKNILFVPSLILFCITSLAFCFFRAKSISEHGISFYMAISGQSMAVFFTILDRKMPKIVELIDGMEKFIMKSNQIVFLPSIFY